MKIRCDVCDIEEALWFCSADEASLCNECDGTIHHANKLASKHLRFSLLQPNCKEPLLCDICQRRALLFCQEDRVILCRECDIPIHKANHQTQKHNRFLLTGIKLSASASLYPTSSPSNDSKITIDTDKRSSQSSKKISNVVPNENFDSSLMETTTLPSSSSFYEVADNHVRDTGSMSTITISEYLMETLPGWLVDDFLDPPSSSATYGFKCDADW
ncbi:zf-B_box domain-containing protein [Cephalotus follicularis]|uniref:Zf-B_box domain-containing protein n=1 Tax=Cephalotus follicularis TaxID=3775 RepID=A0A1Q3C1K6_CEPFO|nr:zf-B_box domain-containing protein [Cephalotus follicularis]